MFGLRHSRTANEQRGLDRHGEPEPTNLVCLWVVRAGACTFGAPSGLGSHRYALQSRSQLRSIELVVVVDPAPNVRIVHVGQVLQGLVTALMKRPPPDCPADGRECLRAGGGHEAVRGKNTLPYRFPRSETETEKIERLVREVAAPVRILAVDDLRLLGM